MHPAFPVPRPVYPSQSLADYMQGSKTTKQDHVDL